MPSVCIWMSRRTADAAGKNCGGVMNKTVLFSLASKHSQGGFLIWIPSPDNHLTTQFPPRRLELKADHRMFCISGRLMLAALLEGLTLWDFSGNINEKLRHVRKVI